MAEEYAQALYEIADTVVNETTLQKNIDALIAELTRSGKVALLPEILRAYERRVAEAKSSRGVSVTIARPTDEKPARTALQKHDFEGEPTIIQDPRIIGGYRLEGNGTMLDATYKTALLKLYKNITTTS